MKIIFVILSLFFVIYLLIPNSVFPPPPVDSVQSEEPGDNETPLRKAYFTNYSREEVIAHYKNLFVPNGFSFLRSFQLRLNYPPEEAQAIIRDQTRSTFLEELAYPLRESIYINGFEPKDAKDDIWYKEQHFRQKIIIRAVPSDVLVRVFVGISTIISVVLLVK